jgi:hypothetical protein
MISPVSQARKVAQSSKTLTQGYTAEIQRGANGADFFLFLFFFFLPLCFI